MSYKIHPGIGVARIGDSPQAPFIGPDQPGLRIAPAGGFRDAECRIRRQAAEFRIFEHTGGTAVEVAPSATTTIRWKVRFAVQRDFDVTAPSSPIVYAGAEVTIDAPGVRVFPPSPARPLAEVEMLPSGHLLVSSAVFNATMSSIGSGDRCEGYVRAEVTTGAGTIAAASSWMLIVQPDYAPGKIPRTDATSYLLALLWPGAPPTSPSLPLTDLLDRAPLSYLGGTNGWELGGRLGGLTLAHFVEPLRFVEAGPPHNLRSNSLTRWHDDLTGCGWINEVATTDIDLPTPARGENWKLRGFLARQADDTLDYVEWCPEVTGAPSSIDFYQVPRGSERAVPIELRLRNFVEPTSVTSNVTGAPSVSLSPTTWSTPTVPEHLQQPHTIWAILRAESGAPLGPVTGTIELDFGGLHSISISVRGEVVEPVPTAIALVLDCSTSMELSRGDSQSRLEGLKSAVEVVVDVARPGDAIAVAPFSSVALTSLGARVLGTGNASDESPSGGRGRVREFVRGLVTVADTSIGAGLQRARTLLASSGLADRALIVVSDGYENTRPLIREVADTIDNRTFAVGIGAAFEPALRALTLENNGFTTIVGDPVSATRRFRLEKYLLAILSGATNGDTILDPEGRVFPGSIERVSFPVSEAELGLDVVVVSDRAQVLLLGIEGPNGEVASFEELRASPGTRVTRSRRVGHLAASLPLRSPSGDSWGSGDWTLLLSSTRDQIETYAAVVLPVSTPVPYAAIINTTTVLRLRADMFARPTGLAFEAAMNRAGAPLERQPTITVHLTGPLDHTSTILLHPDDSGVHHGTFPSTRPGLYTAVFRAVGMSPDGHAYQRERTLEDVIRDPNGGSGRVPPCGCDDYGRRPPENCRSAMAELVRLLAACRKSFKRH